jgi:HTH-type transcriptional regulator/antitoxin HigA
MTLLQAFPPRPIASEEQMQATQARIDALLEKGELSADEEDYLDVLGTLLHDYECRAVSMPDIYGVDLLKVLIEDNNLRQRDLLPIFKTESIVSDVLSGKRKLTNRHIQELATFFNISPAAFFPDPSQSPTPNPPKRQSQFLSNSLAESVENVMQTHRGEAMTTASIVSVLFGDEVDSSALARVKKQLNTVFSRGVVQGRWQKVKGQKGAYVLG